MRMTPKSAKTTRTRAFLAAVSGTRLNFLPLLLLVLLVACSCLGLVTLTQAQVPWTPIYVDTSSKLTLTHELILYRTSAISIAFYLLYLEPSWSWSWSWS